jgi:sulfur-carrier protein
VTAGDLAALRAALGQQPALAPVLEVAALLVDGQTVDEHAPLVDGAVVDVLPPFAGG